MCYNGPRMNLRLFNSSHMYFYVACLSVFLLSVQSSVQINSTCDERREFRCVNTSRCIPLSRVKDGKLDCPDASDERCSPDEFQCRTGLQCIDNNKLFDGWNDCLDGSDEVCSDGQFKCNCGKPVCIDEKHVKDGVKHCEDGSDEENSIRKGICDLKNNNVEDLIAMERKKRQADGDLRPTGLLTATTQFEIRGDKTTRFVTEVYGTYIANNYAKLFSTRISAYRDIANPSELGQKTQGYSTVAISPSINEIEKSKTVYGVSRITETFNSLTSGKVYQTAVNELASSVTSNTHHVNSGENEIRSFQVSNMISSRHKSGDADIGYNTKRYNPELATPPLVQHPGVSTITVAAAGVNSYTVGGSKSNEDFVVYAVQDGIVLDTADSITAGRIGAIRATGTFKGRAYPDIPVTYREPRLLGRKIDSDLTENKSESKPKQEASQENKKSVPNDTDKQLNKAFSSLYDDKLNNSTQMESMERLTLFGFVEFTTTISGTEVVFMPSTTDAKNKYHLTPVQKTKSSKNIKKLENTSPESTTATVRNTPALSITPTKSIILTETFTKSKILTETPTVLETETSKKSKISTETPTVLETETSKKSKILIETPTTLETKTLESQIDVISPSFSSIETNTISVTPTSSFTENETDPNKISVDESKNPSNQLETTMTQVKSTIPDSSLSEVTGLVNSITGTEIQNGVTTHWTTMIIGTHISGTYAHIVQSTSSIFFTLPSTTSANTVGTTSILTGRSVGEDEGVINDLSSIFNSSEVINDYVSPSRSLELVNSASVDPSDKSDSDSLIIVNATEQEVEHPKVSVLTDNFLTSQLASNNEDLLELQSILIQPTKSSDYLEMSSSELILSDLTSPHVEPEIMKDSSKVLSSDNIKSAHSTILTNSFILPSELPPTEARQVTSDTLSTTSHIQTPILEEVNSRQPKRLQYTTLTFFTTYRSGDQYSTSSRIVTLSNYYEDTQNSGTQTSISVTEPAKLHSNYPTLSDAVRPTTYFTTFTYYTTLYKDNTTSVNSRKETVSRIVGGDATKDSKHTLRTKIVRGPQTHLITNYIVPVTPTPSLTLQRTTYFTTYTYYTTIHKGGSTVIKSKTEVLSNVITGTPKSTISVRPTSSTPILPSVTTQLTTYTFFTTLYHEGSSYVSSRESTFTNLITSTKSTTNTPTPKLRTSIKTSFITLLYDDTSTVTTFYETIVKPAKEFITSSTTSKTKESALQTLEKLTKHNDLQTSYSTSLYLITLFSGGTSTVSTKTVTLTNLASTVATTHSQQLSISATPTLTTLQTDDKPYTIRSSKHETTIFAEEPKPEKITKSTDTKKHYSTYTYSVTLFSEGTSTISTLTEIVSNSVTPTAVSALQQITPTNKNLEVTQQTTLTFYTTLFSGTTSKIISNTEYITNVVTLTEPKQSIAATETLKDISELGVEDLVAQADELHPLLPSPITLYTTYTYYTTKDNGKKKTVDTRYVVVSDVLDHPPRLQNTDKSIIPSVERGKISVTPTQRTNYNTYTYYTTNIINGSPVITTRIETKTKIIPEEKIISSRRNKLDPVHFIDDDNKSQRTNYHSITQNGFVTHPDVADPPESQTIHHVLGRKLLSEQEVIDATPTLKSTTPSDAEELNKSNSTHESRMDSFSNSSSETSKTTDLSENILDNLSITSSFDGVSSEIKSSISPTPQLKIQTTESISSSKNKVTEIHTSEMMTNITSVEVSPTLKENSTKYEAAEAQHHQKVVKPFPVTHYTTYTYFTTILKPGGGTLITSHLKVESSTANNILPTRSNHIQRTKTPQSIHGNRKINSYPSRAYHLHPSRGLPTTYTTYTYYTTKFINGRTIVDTRYETITNGVINRREYIQPTRANHLDYDKHRTTYTYHTTRFRDGTALVNTRKQTVTNPAYVHRHTQPLRSYSTHSHPYRFSNGRHCPGCQAQANNAVHRNSAHRRLPHNYPNTFLTSVPVKRLKPNYRSLTGSLQHITYTAPPIHKPEEAQRYEHTIIPTRSTYYTTYTYFTTILKPGGGTVVSSNIKVESSVGNRILPTRVDHVHRTRIPTHGHNERVTIYPSRRTHGHPRYDTARTTYTYFTTHFVNGRTSVDTRYETITNVITTTITEGDRHIHPTRIIRPGNIPHDVHRTTYTYHTTRFRDGTAIVNTRRQTVTNAHPDIAHRHTYTGSYNTRAAYRPSFSSARYDPAVAHCHSCDDARPRRPSARSHGARRIHAEHTIAVPNQLVKPHPVTHYSTYTYFTTSLINGSPVVSSRKETVTQVLSDVVVPTLVPLSGSANNIHSQHRRGKRRVGRRLLSENDDVVYVTATIIDLASQQPIFPSVTIADSSNISKFPQSSPSASVESVTEDGSRSVTDSDDKNSLHLETVHLLSSVLNTVTVETTQNSLNSVVIVTPNLPEEMVRSSKSLLSGEDIKTTPINDQTVTEIRSVTGGTVNTEESNSGIEINKENLTLSLEDSSVDTANKTEHKGDFNDKIQPSKINRTDKFDPSQQNLTNNFDNKINFPVELHEAEAINRRYDIRPTPVTHYTTYTYFTTILKPEGGTIVTSHLKVESSIAHNILPTRTDHIHRIRTYPSNENRRISPSRTRVHSYLSRNDKPTVYTTYTYYTTKYINGRTTISTRYQTITNVISATVRDRNHYIRPTRVTQRHDYNHPDVHHTTYTYHTTRFRDGTALVNTRKETVTNPAYVHRHTQPLRSYSTHSHPYRFSNGRHCPGCQAQANNAIYRSSAHRRLSHNYPNTYLTSVPLKRLKPNYRSLTRSLQHITHTAPPIHKPAAAQRYEHTIIPTRSTYYTTYTYFTTILKPGGGTVVSSNIKVESSVGNRILPTRVDHVHRTRIPTHGHNERVTIYPSRRTHGHPRYDTARTTYTYFTTHFVNGRTSVDTRYETITNVITTTITEGDRHIHPTRIIRPGNIPHDVHRTTYTYHTTRFRDGTAIVNTRRQTVTNAHPDIAHRHTYTGSYNTRAAYRPSFSSARYDPAVAHCHSCDDARPRRPSARSHGARRIHAEHTIAVPNQLVKPHPVTHYSTYTYFTTSLINGSPVVSSRKETVTQVLSDVVVPTLVPLSGSANNIHSQHRRGKRGIGRRLLSEKDDVVYVTATLLDDSSYDHSDMPSFITPYEPKVSNQSKESSSISYNSDSVSKTNGKMPVLQSTIRTADSSFKIDQIQSSMVLSTVEDEISDVLSKASTPILNFAPSELTLKSKIVIENQTSSIQESEKQTSNVNLIESSMSIIQESSTSSLNERNSILDSALISSATDSALISFATDSALILSATDSALISSATDSALISSATDSALISSATDGALISYATDGALISPAMDSALISPAMDSALISSATDSALISPAMDSALISSAMDSALISSARSALISTPILDRQQYVTNVNNQQMEIKIHQNFTEDSNINETESIKVSLNESVTFKDNKINFPVELQGAEAIGPVSITRYHPKIDSSDNRKILPDRNYLTRHTTLIRNINSYSRPQHNHISDIHRTTYTYHTTRFKDGTAIVNTRKETVTNAYVQHTQPQRSYSTHSHPYRFSNGRHCPGCQAQANNAVHRNSAHRRLPHNYPNTFLTSVPVKRLKPNYRSLTGSLQHIAHTAPPIHKPEEAQRYEHTIIPTRSTYYTTYTYFTTILKPGGGTVVSSNIKVESSVGNRILPTRVDHVHRTRIPTHGHNERVTIYPSRRTHGHPRYDTARTTYTYFTTHFVNGRTSVDTRYETITNVITATITEGDRHIHPTRIIRPGNIPHDVHRTTYTYHTTRFRDGTAIVNTRRQTVTNAHPDIAHRRTYTGSYSTRGAYRPSFSSPRYNPGYRDSCPSCDQTRQIYSRYRAINHDHHRQRIIDRHRKPHYEDNIGRTAVESTPVTPLTFYTTYTDFTTTLLNGSPVVKSTERTYTDIISNIVVPTLATIAPTGSSRSYRLSGNARYKREVEPIESIADTPQKNTTIFGNENMINSASFQTVNLSPSVGSTEAEPASHPLGLLSSITNSVISNGITTLFTTKIFGTFLNGLYAHFASTTSTTVPIESAKSTEPTTTDKSSKTGLVSSHTSRVTTNGKTIVYTTNIYGTYIAGVYAQSARTTSNLLMPTLSSSTRLNFPVLSNEINPKRSDITTVQSLTVKESVTPIVSVKKEVSSTMPSSVVKILKTSHPMGILSTSLLRSKVSPQGTTVYYSEIVGTLINGIYAHVGRTASKVIPVTPTHKVGLIAAVTETEVNDKTTILHITETRGTYLNGIYAHVVVSSNHIPTPTKNIPMMTKMPSSVIEASYSENKLTEGKHETPSLVGVNVKSHVVVEDSLLSDKISHITNSESSHVRHKRTPRFQLSKRPSRVFGRSSSQRASKTTGYRSNKSRVSPSRVRSTYSPSSSSTRKLNFPLRRPTRAGRSSVPNQKLRNKKDDDIYEASEAVVRSVTPQLLPSRRPRPLLRSRPSLPIKPTQPKPPPPETVQSTETKSSKKTFTRTRTYDYSLPSSSKTQEQQTQSTVKVENVLLKGKRPPSLIQRRAKQNIDEDLDDFDLSLRTSTKRPTRPNKRRYGTSRGRQPFLQSSFTTTNEIGDSISLPLPPLGLSRGVRKRPTFDPRTIKSSSTIQTIHTRTLSSEIFDIDPTSKLPVTIMSLVTTVKQLPVIVGFRTSTATITTTVYESSIILPHEYTTVVNGDSTKSIFSTTTGIPELGSNDKDTIFTEVLITTATVYTTKLQPIKIGFGTRTDTLIDVQIINTLTTSYNTIGGPSLAQQYPFFNFPQQQFNPFMPFPQQQGYALTTSENSFVTTETILSTKVLPIYRQGKTIYSTITSTSTSESIVVKTTTVPVPQVPQVPHGGAFIIPQPYFIIPPVTTQITVSVTGANGQVISAVTTVTIPIYPQMPHAGFHGRFPRSVRSTPSENYQMTKTTDPTSVNDETEWTDESQFDNLLRSGLREVHQEFISHPTENLNSVQTEEPDTRWIFSSKSLTEGHEPSAVVDYFDSGDNFDDNYEVVRFRGRKLQQFSEEEAVEEEEDDDEDIFQSSETLPSSSSLFLSETKNITEETPSEYFSSLVPLVSLDSTSPSILTSFQVSEVLNSSSAPTDVTRSGSFRKIVTVKRGKHQSNFTRRIKITRAFSPTVGPTESIPTRRRGVVRRLRPGTGYRGQRRPIYIRKHRPTKLPETTPLEEELTSVDYNYTTEQDDDLTTEPTTEMISTEAQPTTKSPAVRIVKLRRPAGKNFTGRSRIVVTRKSTRKPVEESVSLVTFDDDDDNDDDVISVPDNEEKNSTENRLQLPITYYTTYTYFTTVLNGPITSYLSRESVVSNVATQTLDDILVSVIKTNGGFSTQTNSFIPLGSKTHGTTTTVVNFASRLQIFNRELSGESESKPETETESLPLPSSSQENEQRTMDIYELATLPKTFYTLLTHYYTFYDGLSVRHSKREETVSDIATDPATFLQNTYTSSIDENGYLTALPETKLLNLGSTDILGTITQVNLGLKTIVHFDQLANVAVSGDSENVQPTQTLTSQYSQLPYDNRLDPTEPFADDQQLIAEIVPLEPSYVSSGQPDRAFFDITPVVPGVSNVPPRRKSVRIISSLVQKPLGRFRSRAFPSRPGVRVRVRPALSRRPEKVEISSNLDDPEVQPSFVPNQPNVYSSEPYLPLVESSFNDFSSIFGLPSLAEDVAFVDVSSDSASPDAYSSDLLEDSPDYNEDLPVQPTPVLELNNEDKTSETETDSIPSSSEESPKSATGKRIRIILRKTLTSSTEEDSSTLSSEQLKTKPRFIVVTKTGLQGGVRPSNNRLVVTRRIRPGIRTKTLIRPTITQEDHTTKDLATSSIIISPSVTISPQKSSRTEAVTYFTTTTFTVPVTVGDQTFLRTLEKTNSRVVTEVFALDTSSSLPVSDIPSRAVPTYEILLKPSITVTDTQLTQSSIIGITSLQGGPDGTTTHIVTSEDNGHIVTSIFYPGLGSSIAGTKVIRTNQEGTGFTSFYGVIPESVLVSASPSFSAEIPSSTHITNPQPVGGQVSIGGKLNLVTRVSNGVTLIVASERDGITTNTLLPDPTPTLTFQPTLLTDAVLMKDIPKETVTYSTKTFLTTYTFFTTFFSDNEPIVTSSEQVITNLFTAPVTVTLPLSSSISILPRPDINAQAAEMVTLFETKERVVPSTRYSTSTFYATLFTGQGSFVTPVEEVHSDVVPVTETYTVTRTIAKPLQPSISRLTSIEDRISAAAISPVTTTTTLFTTFTKFLTQLIGTNAIVKSTEEITSSVLTLTFPQAISPTSAISTIPLQTSITRLTSSEERISSAPNSPVTTTTTLFTTFTKFLTQLIGTNAIVKTTEEITSSVLTLTFPQAVSPTSAISTIRETQLPIPVPVFTTRTKFLTTTNYITFFVNDQTTLSPIEDVVPVVITERIDQAGSKTIDTKFAVKTEKTTPPQTPTVALIPSVKTFYTTYTFFTTLLRDNIPTIITQETVSTSFATQFVPKSSTSEISKHSSSPDLSTLTFFTTLFNGNEKTVISSVTVLSDLKPSTETTPTKDILTLITTYTFSTTLLQGTDTVLKSSESVLIQVKTHSQENIVPTISETKSISPTSVISTIVIPTIIESSSSFESDTLSSSFFVKEEPSLQNIQNKATPEIIEIKTITSTENSISVATETNPLLAGTSTTVNGSTIVFFSEIHSESPPTLTISSDDVVLTDASSTVTDSGEIASTSDIAVESSSVVTDESSVVTDESTMIIEISSSLLSPSPLFDETQNITEPLTSTVVLSEETEFVGADNVTTTVQSNGTLVLITGTDGAVTRLTELPLPISPSSIETLTITETATRPGPVFELTDLISGNSNIAANIGEAIKGILNKFAKNNTVAPQGSAIPLENREKPPLPPSDGITVSNAEEPTYIPIGALGRSTEEKHLVPILRPSVVAGSGPIGRIPGNDVTIIENTHTPVTLFTGLIIPGSEYKDPIPIQPKPEESLEVPKIITDETIFILPTKTEIISPATNRDDVAPVDSETTVITGEETTFIEPIIHGTYQNSNLQPSSKESSTVSVKTIFFDTKPSISVINSIPTFITPILPISIHSPDITTTEGSSIKTAKSEEITTIIIEDSATSKEPSVTKASEESKATAPISTITDTSTTIFFEIPQPKKESEITRYVTSVESTNRVVTLTTTTIYYTRESPLTISSILTTTVPPRTFVSTIIGTKTILGTLTESTESTVSVSKSSNIVTTSASDITIKATTQAPTPTIKTFVAPTRQVTPAVATTVNRIRPILLGNRTSSRPKYPFTFPTTTRPTGTTKRFKLQFKPPARPTEVTSPRPSGPKAILKFPTPKTTTPPPPTRATPPTTRKPFKKKPGQKVKHDECYPECRPEIKEMCKKVRGEWKCVCRPGFAKKKGSRICEESQQFMLLLRVVKVNNETANYKKEFNNTLSKEYKQFVGIAKKALDDAYNVTDISTNFIGADVISIKDGSKPEGRSVPEDGLLVNYTIQMTRNSPADEKLLRQQLEHSLRLTNFSIGGSELYSSAIIENIRDLDECSDSEYNDCSGSAICINKRGSYECKCKEGYEDQDLKFPGRICSGEIKNCDYCGGRGDCIMTDDDEKICRCHRMYLGKQCEINGLVIAIALPIGLAFLILLAFGLLCCCRRIRRQKKQKAKSGNMFRGIVSPLAGTLDKKAMIMDTSSESSGEHLPRVGQGFDGFANENGKRSSKKSDLSMDRSFSTGFSVPSVMIPRARHHRSHKQTGPASDSGLQSKKPPVLDNNMAESRLLNILEGSAHQARELRNMKEKSSFASLPNRGRMKKRRESDSSDNVSVRLHRLPGIADLSQKSEMRHRHKHDGYMDRSRPNSRQTEARSSVLGMNGTDDYSSQLSERVRKFSHEFDSRTRISPMSDDQSIDRSGFKHLQSERSVSRSILEGAEARNRSSSEAGRSYDETTVQPSVKRYSVASDYHHSSSKGKSSRILPTDDFGTDRDEAVTDVSFSTTAITNARKSERTDLDSERISDSSFFSFVLPKVHYGGKKSKNAPNRQNREQGRNYYCYDQHVSLEDERS
ncbi:LOW QUALITY PROTEIN: uncharacterized protein LOC111626391 [Centruroides sculpturatus]|uniref:LOW QUALITY PROTEIN: uncharacterized protein LOC111626391 n=1 Tax=Centruroides sculpturatus TaxID=218467 RepID=UPI000C6D983F|nr:LOW QUALITY PROTEIN: uncharacterized protein LOC111626391 [Centruroides sculpturatus]